MKELIFILLIIPGIIKAQDTVLSRFITVHDCQSIYRDTTKIPYQGYTVYAFHNSDNNHDTLFQYNHMWYVLDSMMALRTKLVNKMRHHKKHTQDFAGGLASLTETMYKRFTIEHLDGLIEGFEYFLFGCYDSKEQWAEYNK